MNIEVPWPDRDGDRHAGGPGDGFADAMRQRLLEQRIVLVSGNLDDAFGSRVVAELMTLDATGDAPVSLQLDSGGGSLDAAFAIMDTIDLLGVSVRVTCLGRAEGPAVGVLAVGHRRLATEHARIRLTDPDIVVSGPATELAGRASAEMDRITSFHARLAAATRRRVDDVAADCRAGRYLSAAEARSYGLVDELVQRGAKVRTMPGRGIGFGPAGRRRPS